MNNTQRQRGFTMTEAVIATAIMGPIMLGVMGASGAVGGALEENELSAGVTTAARSVSDRLAQEVMRASPDTLQVIPRAAVRVLSTDIVVTPAGPNFYTTPDPAALQSAAASKLQISIRNLGDGSHYVTHHSNYSAYNSAAASQGQAWEPIQQGQPADCLQFKAVVGTVSMNAQGRTEARSLEFVRDRLELPNGIDDDGDGMIDEGKIILRKGNTRSLLISDVEVCSFTLEGRVVRFAIRCCRRDERGRVHRTTIQKRIMIRNNG